jgi:hypothetical protein
MTEEIASPSEAKGNPEEAREIIRKKGMTKGTTGAAETGSEYEGYCWNKQVIATIV